MRHYVPLLIIVLFSAMIAIPTHAADFTASNATELIDAINTANGNGVADTITLTSNITLTAIDNNTDGDNGLPSITSEIEIIGNGHTILRSRAGSTPDFRFFHIATTGDLNLNNVTITNGSGVGAFPSNIGGSILNEGTLTLTNSTLSGNSALAGGAIFSVSSQTLNIIDSTISQNTAAVQGGAIYEVGDSTINIVNSTLSQNEATTDGGGAIFINNAATITNITDTRIFNNIAGTQGGAIFSNGNVTMDNAIIRGNAAASAGGAIYHFNGTLMIMDSTLSRNTSIGKGGAIYARSGNLTIANSNISNNSTTDEDGGGISIETGNTTMSDSTLSGNRAGDDGGAIENNGTLTASNLTISSNQAGDDGGAIENNGTLIASNLTISSNQAGDNGGALDIDNGTATINNSTLSGNQAEEDGGAIDVDNSTVTINNSTLSSNQSGNDGAALFIDSGTVTINTSTISNNRANDDGGGIDNRDALTIINSTLSSNRAADNGGAIDNRGTIILRNSTFSGNQTVNDGGGIINRAGNITLTNSIIANSSRTDYFDDGGGILLSGNNIVEDGSITDIAVINVDPNLAGLADNGGPTRTHALRTGSLAIDSSGAGATASDQRGAAAVNTRDIGAYETNATLPMVSFTIDETILYEIGPTIQATVTITVTNFVDPFEISIGFTGTSSTSDYTTTYAGSYAIAANGDTTFTIDIVDDPLAENPETLILTLLPIGSVDVANPESRTITLISDEVPPNNPSSDNEVAPEINVFDPAISKIGVLFPGQTGVVGEQLEWIVTVSNVGNEAGTNVTITDTLIDALQIDSVNAPNGNVNIDGQTVTVVYPTLGVGESVQFSIFTTVLEGVTLDNEACVSADNQATVECAFGQAVSQLPSTGETPAWRNYLWILVLISVISLGLGVFYKLGVRKPPS